MAERGVSFKRALDEAIRDGATSTTRHRPFRAATADLGLPSVNLDRALQVAAELEDDEIVRKARAGK